jgi:hypothetical protein
MLPKLPFPWTHDAGGAMRTQMTAGMVSSSPTSHSDNARTAGPRAFTTNSGVD